MSLLARRVARVRPGCRSLFLRPSQHAISRTEEVRLEPADLYNVVAEVEKYSDFVPFCSEARVLERHGPSEFDAELALNFMAFSERYVSRVTLTPHSAVTAVATDTHLFDHLHTSWRFDGGSAPGTCRLHFSLELLLKSVVHDRALGAVIDRIAAQQVAAFRERCARLVRGRAAAPWAAAQPQHCQQQPGGGAEVIDFS